MKTKYRKGTIVAGAVLTAMLALTAAECGSDTTSDGQKKEAASRTSNFDRLAAAQPAHTVKYSPTRATKNAWIDTWGQKPGVLAYMYIQNMKGEYGYYVLKGLPVSYCVSLVSPDQIIETTDGDGSWATNVVRAPSMDGTYGSGANCNSYYGIDAVTGAYMEFSVGIGQSYQLFSQPMDLPQYEDASPMGPSTIDEAKKLKKN